MNIVMVIAIIAMFIITLNSDQPNVLNYERNLQNKYATWEQELTQREQTVREKGKRITYRDRSFTKLTYLHVIV